MQRLVPTVIAVLFAASAFAFDERPVADVVLKPFQPNFGNMAAGSNGRNFLIVFSCYRSQWALCRAVVDPDGNVLDSRTLILQRWSDVVAIASDGERYLVALDDDKPLLLDADGHLLRVIESDYRLAASDGVSFLLASEHALQLLDRNGDTIGGAIALGQAESVVALGAGGSRYLVVTATALHTYMRSLARGILSPPIELPGKGYPYEARVASSGDEALVAIRSPDNVRALVLRADGTVTAPVEWPVRASTLSTIWSGSDYMIAWSDDDITSVARVSRGGEMLAAPRRIAADAGRLAWNGSRLLFAGNKGEQQPFTLALEPVAPALPFAPYTVEQRWPRIATDGESMLVMWREPGTLRVARIAADGTHLDGAGIILTDAVVDYFVAYDVAFDGRDWVLAYPRAPGIAIRRLSSDGVLHPATTLPAGNENSRPVATIRVAVSPAGEVAVAWTAAYSSYDPRASTVWASVNGSAPRQLSKGLASQPDVAWVGNAFRVAWVDLRSYTLNDPYPEYYEPTGVTIATLAAKGTFTIDEVVPAYAATPQVAGDFVTWSLREGLAVHRNGEVTIVRGVPYVFDITPALAADDAGRALFVWYGLNALLLGADSSPFAIGKNAFEPDVVWTRNGFVAAYAHVVAEPPYNYGRRIFIRSVDLPPRRHALR